MASADSSTEVNRRHRTLREQASRVLISPSQWSQHSEASNLNPHSQAGKVHELQNYVNAKIELMKRNHATVKKCTQLAAFIPDFILMEEMSRKLPYQTSRDAVVLFADVSGFTALTEAYSLKGKGGTDQLTKTLMNYIGPLAECILYCDGDIVKYAGDAFLAFWPSSPDDFPEDVQRAIDCALYIQEKYGSYLCKDVGITIKVKIGIGAGMIHLSWLGNESYQHYVCFGPGVEAASGAEKHCTSGEVILHPSAWKCCSPSNYRVVGKEAGYQMVTDINTFVNPQKRGRPLKKTRRSIGWSGLDNQAIRPQLAQCVEIKEEDFMRKFVLPAVLKKLDDDIPLEYINESRNICICFIHVETQAMPREGIAFRETMTKIVNKGFLKIYSIATKMQGALTKVIMFDKGLTYLVAFGLPGYINENQSAHALKFSDQVRHGLLAIPFVTAVSIGVTTGSCYCGVLGHPRRQEYTMIGRKVNKAARLMCYYPGKVTCDQDTAYHSKLAMSNFELQEHKELKGIANPGKIYAFTNKDTLDNNAVSVYTYPILGREPEIKYFREVLFKVQREFSEHLRVSAMSGSGGSGVGKEVAVAKGVWMIVFEGDIGVGKSRMLGACIAEAERQNVKVFSVAMNLILSGQSLFGLSSLVVEAIGISELRTIQEREDFLRKRVTDADLAADLCVLNDIMHTKFPLNPKYQALDVNATHLYGQHVLSTLLKVLYPEELIVLAIDDAHLMDTISWEYIGYLARTPYVFTICSLRRNNAGSPRLPDTVSRIVYHNKNIKTVRLSGLDTQFCLPLACQLMDVNAIPHDVLKILASKSQGIPAWCDQVLHELVRTGVLRISDFQPTWKRQYMTIVERKHLEKNRHAKRMGKTGRMGDLDFDAPSMSTITSSMLGVEEGTPLSRGSSMQDIGLAGGSEDVDPTKRMLVVKSDTNIAHIPISGTLNEILLDSFDELNSTEQIILKGASVLGKKFSKLMLSRVLTSEFDPKKAEVGLNHLMESRYLRCGSRIGAPPREKGSGYTEPLCFCKPDEIIDGLLNPNGISTQAKRPKYFDCKCMEFVKENLVEVVYNLMTEDHRKKFHLRAAKYLDGVTDLRCESCGGSHSLYAYGITIKSADLGLIDDDIMRSAAATTKKKSVGKGTNEGDEVAVKKNRKTSAVTQLEGLKKVLVNNGAKVGQIEVDILRTLRHIEIEGRPKCNCFNGNEDADELGWEAEELEKELHELRDEGEPNVINLKAQRLEAGTNGEGDSKPVSPEPSGRPIDLRTCECNPLQAKFCIEMVKHYREAQKYGKCLVNLLEAAESVINMGNGTQALIHLEDTVGLMKAIKKGDFPAPAADDKEDALIDFDDADGQVEYLSGLAYFEIGVNTKARDFFIKSLTRLGLNLSGTDEGKFNSGPAIFRARMTLWRSHYCNAKCCNGRRSSKTKADLIGNEVWAKEVRILSYLHILFKQEKKYEMALLATLWAVIIAEQFGEAISDVIPAYCHMMEMYSALAQHKDAEKYEKRALKLIRSSFGSNEQIDAIGLVTTANLFLEVALTRLSRGSIATASEAGYLTLQITQTLHENSMLVRIMPTLIQSLLLSLRVTEAIEALQKLWYTAEEEDDWLGVAMYYTLCLELLLNTAYPMENFVTCESFVTNSDWQCESNMYRDFEIQYNMESSLALWYARYSRWDLATKWSTEAESHKPKLTTFVTVSAECKLLECLLIIVEHYLDSKRYQHFAKARTQAKLLMRSLVKSTKVVPMWQPRFLHLMAYYYRIRSRNVDADKQMKAAEKLATKHGNRLEQEWIIHNRTVWNEQAIPTVKYFWLEHTETHTLDWHSSGKIPWANIMYSLPLPEWKG